MAYLYGDATPFPLDVDFVEVLRDLVDACVSILQIDEAIENTLQQVEGAVSSAERGSAGLDKLAASVAATIEDQRGRTESSFVGEIASRVMHETMQVLEAARRDANSRGGMARAEADSKVNARRAKLPGVLERFLLKHELPGTQWGILWSCHGEARAEAHAVAVTPVGLEANFELGIRAGHDWATPVKVSDLRPDLEISHPKKGRFSSQAKMREEKLDKYLLTEVNLAPGKAVMTVRRAIKGTSPGFEIVLRSAGQSMPTVRALDDPSRPDHAVSPETSELLALEELWTAVERGLRPLVSERVRMLEASLDDVAVTAIDMPARIALALIQSVADLARTLRRRSPIGTELSLKRQLEPGRREEIYVPIADLDEMIGGLTAERRGLFDTLGLHAPPPPPVRIADMFEAAATTVRPGGKTGRAPK